MKYEVMLTITHPSFDNAIVHRDTIEAMSKSMATRHFKLSGKQVCDLKKYGECSWFDHRNVKHVLSLKEEN